MKNVVILLLICPLLSFGQQFRTIPTSEINVSEGRIFWNHMRDTNKIHMATIDSFKISEFITFKEYKTYLYSVKKDSNSSFYSSQFPDSNISPSKHIYLEYITNKKYENHPVLGISWDNAFNYCKWKTINDNHDSEIEFIYRLPFKNEWLSALHHLEDKNVTHDLNKNYSDWVLDVYDESAYNFSIEIENRTQYYHNQHDPMALKRKKVLGSSYVSEQNIGYYYYGYATEGYRQISFRLVKEVKNATHRYLMKYWNLE